MANVMKYLEQYGGMTAGSDSGPGMEFTTTPAASNNRSRRITGIGCGIAFCLLSASWSLNAEPLDLSVPEANNLRVDMPLTTTADPSSNRFEFVDPGRRGFETRRLTSRMKVRGWKIGTRALYVGQAKVGRKWGPGIVLDRGETVFGLNHRGVEITRKL